MPTPAAPPRLYAPGQVLAAGLLGGPLAAVWLVSANFRRWGERRRASAWLWLAAPPMVLLLAFRLLVGRGAAPGVTGLSLGLSVAVYRHARRVQGPVVTGWVAAGGEREPWWKAIGAGVAVISATLVAGTLLVLVVG